LQTSEILKPESGGVLAKFMFCCGIYTISILRVIEQEFVGLVLDLGRVGSTTVDYSLD